MRLSTAPLELQFMNEIFTITNLQLRRKAESSMDSTDRDVAPPPQLLSLGRQDTTRLLEVYVKRSLSFEGRAGSRKLPNKYRKWVPLPAKTGGVRRHSSDSSVHLGAGDDEEGAIASFMPAPPESPVGRPVASELESSAEHKQDDQRAKKGAKKPKKPTWIKSFLNLFSRKEERKSKSPERVGSFAPADTNAPSVPCQPAPGPDPFDSPQTRSFRRSKRPRRRFSLRNRDTDQPRRSLKKPDTLALSEPGQVLISDVVCVAPTSLYYETVSEELERIVKEVKDSPTDEHRNILGGKSGSFKIKNAKEAEAIEKILNLLKQQGDDINEELKGNNGWLGSFLGNYSSYRQLADLYVESGNSRQLAEGAPIAPELVKFAFSLDFTAKVAGLSSQTLGRVMGFGNQYLQDRFTQMSAAQGMESQLRPEQHFSGPD